MSNVIKFVPKTMTGATQLLLLSLAGVIDDPKYGKGEDSSFISVAHALYDMLERSTSLDEHFLIFLGLEENPQDVTHVCLGERLTNQGSVDVFRLYGTSLLDSSKDVSTGIVRQKYRSTVKNEDSANPLHRLESQSMQILIGGEDEAIIPMIGVQPLSNVLVRELMERKENPNLNAKTIQPLQVAKGAETNLLPSSVNNLLDLAVKEEERFSDLEGGSLYSVMIVIKDYAEKFPTAEVAVRYYGSDVTVDAIDIVDAFSNEVLYQNTTIPDNSQHYYSYNIDTSEAWWSATESSTFSYTQAILFDSEEGRVLLENKGTYWSIPTVKDVESTPEISGATVERLNLSTVNGADAVKLHITLGNPKDEVLHESVKANFSIDYNSKAYRWFALSSFPERTELDALSVDIFYDRGWGNALVSKQTRTRYKT